MHNYRVLTLVNFLAFIAIGINSPLLTLYLQGLGADFAFISVILTSTILVMLVSNPAWGWLADRLGRRKPLYIVGLAGAALGYFWLSAADNVATAWPARLLDALSMAGVSTLGLTLMGDTLDASQRRGRSMGLTRGLASLAFAAGAFMGGRLADAFGISSVFGVCGGFLAAAALVALLLHEVKPTPVAVAVAAPPVAPSPRPLGLPALFLAGVVLWTAAHVASTSMWPNYMEANGYSKTTISSLWSLAALIEMPAMWLGGALSDITGRAVVLAAGGVLVATVQIGYLLLVASLPALLGVQMVRGFGFGSYTAASMTFASEVGGKAQRGGNSGLFNTAGSAGQLAGSLLGGMLVQAAGFRTLFLVCAGLALCSALCFLLLRRQGVMPVREQPAS
ncbi:MAG TPA: MFS transporter [Chloroflexi bacterium]|nr:MFS transporter [Chloroflexota bacterium]